MSQNLPSNSKLELSQYTRDELEFIALALFEEVQQYRNAALPLPPEERICIEQIRLMDERSQDRELSLDDARKFEIFHKNLRQARGQVVEADKGKSQKKLTTNELLKIASAE